MEPRFEDWPALAVVGLQDNFHPPEISGIPALWRALRPRMAEVVDRVGDRVFGIAHNFQPQGFDYMAGVETRGAETPPEGMARLDLAPQHYAIFTHKLDGRPLPETLPSTLGHIFKTWLPASDYRRTAAPELELYDARFDSARWQGEMEILIPVEAKP